MNQVPQRLASALAGRYVLEREIGAGGMATVYLARDLRHKRAVAVKVIRPELAGREGSGIPRRRHTGGFCGYGTMRIRSCRAG